jgi:hypothetical protein
VHSHQQTVDWDTILEIGPALNYRFFPLQNGALWADESRSLRRIGGCDFPGAAPGVDCRDIVGARLDYAALDRASNPVRIRLSSLVTRVKNLGEPSASKGVEVTYLRGGRSFAVKAEACVLASWNMMIPYLCPDLPEPQKAALHELVKTPLVYTSVALANWTAFERLKVGAINAPWWPPCTAASKALTATTVFPEPTSPWSSRCMGRGSLRSAFIS